MYVFIQTHYNQITHAVMRQIFVTLAFSFQIFVTYFSQCLHAEYKSKGVIVQVNYTTHTQNWSSFVTEMPSIVFGKYTLLFKIVQKVAQFQATFEVTIYVLTV